MWQEDRTWASAAAASGFLACVCSIQGLTTGATEVEMFVEFLMSFVATKKVGSKSIIFYYCSLILMLMLLISKDEGWPGMFQDLLLFLLVRNKKIYVIHATLLRGLPVYLSLTFVSDKVKHCRGAAAEVHHSLSNIHWHPHCTAPPPAIPPSPLLRSVQFPRGR